MDRGSKERANRGNPDTPGGLSAAVMMVSKRGESRERKREIDGGDEDPNWRILKRNEQRKCVGGGGTVR